MSHSLLARRGLYIKDHYHNWRMTSWLAFLRVTDVSKGPSGTWHLGRAVSDQRIPMRFCLSRSECGGDLMRRRCRSCQTGRGIGWPQEFPRAGGFCHALRCHSGGPRRGCGVCSKSRPHGRQSSVPRRSVLLSGTVAQMNVAYAVELGHYESPTQKHRGREEYLYLPNDPAEIVDGVFCLDNRG